MAILPHTGIETLPAGTTNVQGIIDNNFAILDSEYASHHVIPSSTSITIDSADGRTQEMDISGNNVTITGFTNADPGKNIFVVLHSANARNVTVPAAWEPTGVAVDAAGETVVSNHPTHEVVAGSALCLLIIPGVALTTYAIL